MHPISIFYVHTYPYTPCLKQAKYTISQLYSHVLENDCIAVDCNALHYYSADLGKISATRVEIQALITD